MVARGYCAEHARDREQRRGSAAFRGYGSSPGSAWQRFRVLFISLLIAAGIAPVCGAALPDGPQTEDSRCKAAGLLTFTNPDGSSLHVDHAPALTPAEHEAARHGDRRAFDDPRRVQLLCASCHAAKVDRGGL